MPAKLNSYILKDRTINSMKEMIQKTRDDKLERQFDLCLCKKTGTLFHMNECVGDICSVMSRKICVGGEFKGSYHTHPKPFSEKPSTGDLLNILNEGMGCVGSAETNKIKCLIFNERNREYKYLSEAYNDIKEVDDIENDIVGDAAKKPELWPKIAKQVDSLKEKDEVIRKYFRTLEVV